MESVRPASPSFCLLVVTGSRGDVGAGLAVVDLELDVGPDALEGAERAGLPGVGLRAAQEDLAGAGAAGIDDELADRPEAGAVEELEAREIELQRREIEGQRVPQQALHVVVLGRPPEAHGPMEAHLGRGLVETDRILFGFNVHDLTDLQGMVRQCNAGPAPRERR
jgi:hypothetical protein